ncbi:hypothetical protein, partial [Anaerotardibacter muris]|uniref:hypothetical protein n=1 Tax=Anaerotardibacter muris TaxID=2941505 RepID=UPI00203D6AA8
MRVLEWALESQKTLGGKIISIVLSFTLIFSLSNFFYGVDAFAEDAENVTDVELVDEAIDSEDSVLEDEVISSEDPVVETEAQDEIVQPEVQNDVMNEDVNEVAESDGIALFASKDSSTSRVYVYVKVDGDKDGWTQNGHGWYTVGYFDVPSSELPNASHGDSAAAGFDFKNYLSKIVFYEKNPGKSLIDAIDWDKSTFGLHTAYGATDYSEASSTELAWHLDGYLYINNKYNVDYKIEGIDSLDLTNTQNEGIVNTGTEGVTGSIAPAAPEGYAFLGWYRGNTLITEDLNLTADLAKENVSNGTVGNATKYVNTTFVAKYVKDDSQTKTVSYTVKHVVDGTEQEADTQTYEAEVWINEENPVLDVVAGSLAENTYTGYKFAGIEGAAQDATQVVAGTEVVLNYVKDDSQTKTVSYTVKHVVDGTEQEA